MHRGETVAVEVGNPAAETVKHVKCEICEREFVNTQGLGTHKLSCEKKHNVPSTSKQTNELFCESSSSSSRSSSDPTPISLLFAMWKFSCPTLLIKS